MIDKENVLCSVRKGESTLLLKQRFKKGGPGLYSPILYFWEG